MTDPSPPPHARLVTVFGSVLYVNTASGELRHGPIDGSPANAVFAADPNSSGPPHQGWLMHHADGVSEPIRCRADRCLPVSLSRSQDWSAAPTRLELIPLERGLIALRADGLFLSARPDGPIELCAPVCSTWEFFVASQDWCSAAPADDARAGAADAPQFDRKAIAEFIVHPAIRARANTKPRAKKILIYGYTRWSHGRVYYDLCKHLHRRGYILDILDWQAAHNDYIAELITYYDFFMTALDGVHDLVVGYAVPYERIIAISHHEFDIRMLIEQEGIEVFDKFANYGVVSDFLYCASMTRGVRRAPMVASLGITYADFHAAISDRLTTVGYASSMAVETYGVEWKRGALAEAAVSDAGLAFKVAGSTDNQISFHDMPEFYRSVDAVVISSISEVRALPVMEAAAAGRLVIGTPVGHFPLRAYQGGGIIAPAAADKFRAFTAATLRYYKDNPTAYVEKCR